MTKDEMVRWHHQLNGDEFAAKSLQLCPTLCDPIDTFPRRTIILLSKDTEHLETCKVALAGS